MVTRKARSGRTGRARDARRGYRATGRDSAERNHAERRLRESEERFRALTELSSDLYWEQDEQYRFTAVAGRAPAWLQLGREQLLGKRRWDQDYLNMSDADWAAHRATLEQHLPFRDLELCRRNETGELVWICVSGEPVFGPDGVFKGYRGVGRDITKTKRAEQRLRLEHGIARMLADATDVSAALRETMRMICEAEDWDCAEFWRVDEAAGVMRLAGSWVSPDRPEAARFIERSKSVAFRRGQGLAGAVWESARPLWIPDVVADPRILRKDLARETGLKSAFFFPVVHRDKVLGVLDFTCRELRTSDERLTQAFQVIGAQIGQFLERRQAEAALRESEARFRALTELSSDWYWEQDAGHRFTRLEGAGIAAGDALRGYTLIGKTRWESDLEVEGGWEAHRALLEARRPFRDVVMWRTLGDGSRSYVSVSGEPVADAAGRFAGYRGVGRVITAQKRDEQILRLQHEVARLLALAEDASHGLRSVIRAVCEAESFATGRYFRFDGELLRFQDAWCIDDPAIAPFVERSRGATFRPGDGLTGTAYRSGDAVWSADIGTDPRVRDRTLWQGTGLRGGFAFPVVTEGRIVGVLNFSGLTAREPDERLLQASRVIGSQIGQFLERVRAEEQMRRFRLAMDESVDIVLLIDRATLRYVYANAAACQLLGYTREELLGMTPMDLIPGLSREALEREYNELTADPARTSGMYTSYRCKDGTLLPFESTRRAIRSGDSWIIVAISRDIRRRLAAEEALRESEARFRALTQMSSDFFWETDTEHRFTQIVQGSGGMRPDANVALLGKTPWELPSTSPDASGWAGLRETMNARRPFRDFEFGRAHAGGGVRMFSVSGEPRFGADGRFLGYRGVGSDVTDTVLARERIASLAYSDALTGLANRTSLAPALEQALERARRRKSAIAGVYIDLDGFKPVNDTFGHEVGDRLLVETARRVRSQLRASDVVARLGGDEFFVVLEEPAGRNAVEVVANKLLAEIARPFAPAPGREAVLTASIGASLFPEDALDAATLIRHADLAMYEAKQCGKNCFRFYAASG